MAAGNRHLGYKEALNAIEVQSPGTKAAFYFEYLDKAAHLFNSGLAEDQEGLNACSRCGSPTSGEVCAFCRLTEKATTIPSSRRLAVEGGA
jgi:tRNA(Ile)-lysidine synthase TilS/MesJ